MAEMSQGESAGGAHLRINERLREYWLSLCDGRKYPSESDIDPDQIKDIWPSCFLVRVSPPDAIEHGYKYTYLGMALIEAYGNDVTNEDISSRLIAPDSPPLVKKFDEVRTKGEPVVDESEFVNRNKIQVKYRSCMLPLGGASGAVDYIIGGMKWKAY